MTNLGGTGVSENTDIDDEITELFDRQDRLNPLTLVAWQAEPRAKAGDVVTTKERSSGNGGGATGDIVSSLTVNVNGFEIVGHNTLALAFEMRDTDGNVLKYGALPATADNGSFCNAAITHVNKLLIPDATVIKALNIAIGDKTKLTCPGTLKIPDSAGEWASILINKDIVNGNTSAVLDFTGGEFDGNRVNQDGPLATVHHVMALFFNCSNFNVFGGKYGKNYAPETTPVDHPLFATNPELFEQGNPLGETGQTFPTIGVMTFMGGRNNHVHGFNLIDWAQEGISPRWNEGSSVTDFRAINGPETSQKYYAPITFGSRAGSVTVADGDNVLVQEGHKFGGVEQQPHLIYVFGGTPGVIDLGLENFTSGGDWTLVERDTSGDLGFTSARISGSFGQLNLIAHGYAAFCRASSFSNDSPISGMQDLFSYHNSFQVGINLGHANTGADSGVSSNLIVINSGWKDGVGGNGFGINVVGATKDAQLVNIYVCGAARNGVNQSDSGENVKILGGIVKFSGAGGIKTSAQKMTCSHVTSRNNVGLDFEPTGEGFMVLDHCVDSTGNIIHNENLTATTLSQTERTMRGTIGTRREVWRDSFAVASGAALVTLTGTVTFGDNMILSVTYSERNTGSGSAANQRACKTTFLVSGSVTARTVQILEEPYQLQRKLRVTWDIGTETVEVFLTDLASADVAANNTNNSCFVEIQNNAYEYNTVIG